MSSMGAAPSWVSTTRTWLESSKFSHFDARVTPVRTAKAALRKSLIMMSFRQVELRDLKGMSLEEYEAVLSEMVDNWDEECHRQVREFLNEGGYAAEKIKFVVLAVEPAPVPDEVLEKVTKDLKPAAEHTPEQELEEAVAAERMARDPRLGAW